MDYSQEGVAIASNEEGAADMAHQDEANVHQTMMLKNQHLAEGAATFGGRN